MLPKQLSDPKYRFILIEPLKKRPVEEAWTLNAEQFVKQEDGSWRNKDTGELHYVNRKVDGRDTRVIYKGDLHNYSYYEPKLKQHISEGGNYGVVGGFGNLIILDFDKEEYQNSIVPTLPETFTVKTAGKGLYHCYFEADNTQAFKVMNLEKDTIIDVQGTSTQVVGPGSKLENGRTYDVVKDVPIAKITRAELNAIFSKIFPPEWMPALREKKTHDETKIKNPIYQDIIKKLSIKQVLEESGINTNTNPCMCPLGHNSFGGKCFGFNDETWHCFHCQEKGTVIDLVMKVNKLTFGEAVDKLCERLGIQNKKRIKHPVSDKLISEFAKELGFRIKDRNELYYKVDERAVVRIENNKFTEVQASSFITLIEKFVIPGIYEDKKGEDGQKRPTFVKKSIGKELAKSVLDADEFKLQLPHIKRIFTVPTPMLCKGELTFPKKGYDERFESWLLQEAPSIVEGTKLDDAKEVLNNVFAEFCFKEEQDKINAMAALITPFLRGLYVRPTVRTPIFFYEANRERAGKDYCAGITGIVYEGQASEEPPISSEDNHKTAAGDELRKKLMAALKSGRKRLHFSNNRGHLANAVIESFSTSEQWTDRVLGKNEELSFGNEVELSLSANVGITYTSDFANRCRKIRLFLDIEDANSRKFKNPVLHQQVFESRDKILGAIYSLIQNWINNNKPAGTTTFSSFAEWARVCGGIMQAAKIGDPCAADKELLSIGGDSETKDFKKLFELCYAKRPEQWIKKSLLKDMVKEFQEENEIFNYLDLNERSGQVKFAIRLERYVGRIFDGKKMIKDGTSPTAASHLYKFTDESMPSLNNYVVREEPKKEEDVIKVDY
jgi:Bifunctional DNA primase/polymerase, N-terminal/CHC2 zinc finger